MTLRRLLVPLLVVVPMLAILIGFGTWQLHRLAWKTGLLADIAASEALPPRPLSGGAAPLAWMRVTVTGRFDHEREVRVGLIVRGPVLGTRLVTPLLREGAAPILVDRGWIPMEGAAIARPEGILTLEGYLHPGEQAGYFSATDDVAGRRFYTFDPPRIGAALGLPAVAPQGFVVLGQGAGFPDPARTLPRPTNSHLGYVVTWYGLALSLLGVFAVWARRRLKEAP